MELEHRTSAVMAKNIVTMSNYLICGSIIPKPVHSCTKEKHTSLSSYTWKTTERPDVLSIASSDQCIETVPMTRKENQRLVLEDYTLLITIVNDKQRKRTVEEKEVRGHAGLIVKRKDCFLRYLSLDFKTNAGLRSGLFVEKSSTR